MIPTWFLYVQGFGMLVMGIGLLVIRPRKPGDSWFGRYVNVGTLWAIGCTAAGVILLLMARGYLSWNAPPHEPDQTHRRVRHR